MTRPKGVKRRVDESFRNQWLREEAPFSVVGIDELAAPYHARQKEWKENGITHCVIGKSGYPWAQYGGKGQVGAPQQYCDNLNDESLLAIMTGGTAAEKLI